MFLAIHAISDGAKGGYAERAYYSVSYQSQILEEYLDLHGANRNSRFHTIRYDVSGLKWVSKAISCLLLLKDGPSNYPTADRKWGQELLIGHVDVAIAYLQENFAALITQLEMSWTEAGMAAIEHSQGEIDVHPPLPVLPADLEDSYESDSLGDSKSPSPLYLTRFIRLYNRWDAEATKRLAATSAAEDFMKSFCTEAIARSFESRMHSLQSDYDSHIRNTSHELASPNLRQIRGAVSQSLHLLEAVTALTHLYERHRRHLHLSQVFSWDSLAAMIINHLVLPAYKCIESSIPVAESLLETLSPIECVEVRLPEGVEMHARPLSLIAGVVKHFGMEIEIECEGERANAASFMGMLVLIGSRPNCNRYKFFGCGAALNDIETLFELGLGELGLDKVTRALPYLK